MKAIKVLVPMLLLLAMAFAVAGCPKGDKMMDAREPARAASSIG